jgi:hypothetical protein
MRWRWWCRIYASSAQDSEQSLLSLCMLPTSFEYLQTVNGQLHETFQQACRAYGLSQKRQDMTWHTLSTASVPYIKLHMVTIWNDMRTWRTSRLIWIMGKTQAWQQWKFHNMLFWRNWPCICCCGNQWMLKHYSLSLHKLHLAALEIPTASLNLQSFKVLEERTKAIAIQKN